MIRTATLTLPARLDKARSEVEVTYRWECEEIQLLTVGKLRAHLFDDDVAEWITEQLIDQHAAAGRR